MPASTRPHRHDALSPAGRRAIRQDGSASQFFQRSFERIDALPGVQASGAVSFLPLTGLGSATSYEVVGQPVPPRGQEPVADVRVIDHTTTSRSMGIPLLRGRLFDERDAAMPRTR